MKTVGVIWCQNAKNFMIYLGDLIGECPFWRNLTNVKLLCLSQGKSCICSGVGFKLTTVKQQVPYFRAL